MRQLWLLVALVGGGCNSILGINELTVVDAPPGSEDVPSVPVDAPYDAPPLPTDECFGTPTFGRVCFTPSSLPALTLPATIDTSNNSECTLTLTGPPTCVIIGQSITVPIGGTAVTGSRPLMLVASTTIDVAGDLSVGSIVGGRRGPGADPAAPLCLASTPGGDESDEGGGGGGAGGSFGSQGANGGTGAGPGAGGGGNAGGIPTSNMTLRGGCPGSSGGRGDGSSSQDRGAGGSGGGAVYLVAGTTLHISAKINASGSGGGAAGGNLCGGGGGGSGGQIVLEAITITIDGAGEVFANGGGGGEGTTIGTRTNGSESTAYNDAGDGGSGGGGSNGGDGDDGAVGATLAKVGKAGSGTAGGGAGGGGLGVIWTKGMVGGATATRFSPSRLTFTAN